MLFDQGAVAMVGDGMEVKIEGCAAGQADTLDSIEPNGGPVRQQAGVNTAGVLGEGGALGEGVEAAEQGQTVVEDVGHDAGGTADAPELEGEQGAAGASGGDSVAAGQATTGDELVETEAGEQGQEQEQAAEGGAEGALGEVEGAAVGGGSLEWASSFEDAGSGAAAETRQVGLPEDGGDGGDAAGEAFAFEHGGDLVGGELVGVAELDDALGA